MKKRIVCFGDSNTWGYKPGEGSRYDEETRYTGVLQKEMGCTAYVVVEEGLNGRTTAFADYIEPERCAIEHIRPILFSQLPMEYLVVMLGTNDTKSHFQVTAEEIGYGLEELLSKIQYLLRRGASCAKVIVVAPTPLGVVNDSMFNQASVEKSSALAPIFENIAKDYGYAFLDAGKLGLALGCDGIHLSEMAHSMLGSAIAQLIKELEGKER